MIIIIIIHYHDVCQRKIIFLLEVTRTSFWFSLSKNLAIVLIVRFIYCYINLSYLNKVLVYNLKPKFSKVKYWLNLWLKFLNFTKLYVFFKFFLLLSYPICSWSFLLKIERHSFSINHMMSTNFRTFSKGSSNFSMHVMYNSSSFDAKKMSSCFLILFTMKEFISRRECSSDRKR